VVLPFGLRDRGSLDEASTRLGEDILGDDEPDIEIVDPELDPGTIKQTELRQDGLDVSYYRKVTAPDGTIISDRGFRSIFAARGDVWKVSPDEKGKSPAVLDPHKVGSDKDESSDDSGDSDDLDDSADE